MEKQIYVYEELLTKYIITKLKEGYEPTCTREELVQFLDFISYFINLEDKGLSYNGMIEHFLNGPSCTNKRWNIRKEDFDFIPTIEVTDAGLIVPTYDLRTPSQSSCDSLENDIKIFLKRNAQIRSFDNNDEVDEDSKDFSDNVAATILLKVWDNKIENLIREGNWPRQCRDIKKYLIDMDLAPKIELNGMQEELLQFYYTVQSRTLSISKNDPNFRMTNFEEELLAKANLDAIMQNYSYFPSRNQYQQYFVIDRQTNAIHDVIDHYNKQIKTIALDRPLVKELVKVLKR